MLLVVKNHTFPPFDGISNIITLANIMANHKTHSLRQNKICILPSFTTKNAKGETTYNEGPMLFDLG